MERMKLPRSGVQCFDAECIRLESAPHWTASDRGLDVKLSVVNLNICFVIRVTILSIRAASQNNTKHNIGRYRASRRQKREEQPLETQVMIHKFIQRFQLKWTTEKLTSSFLD